MPSALPEKPVCICQPAPCSYGSVIDLSAPEAVEENPVLPRHNLALSIVVGQLKSREQVAGSRCRVLEELLDREWSDNQHQCNVIHDLEACLANNNTNLISELQEYITILEESAKEASWSEWRHSEQIRRLGEDNSLMRNSINWERSHNDKVHQKNCHISGEIYRLQAQINDLRASRPGMGSKTEYPPSEESISCAADAEETAGVDNPLSDDNSSLFSRSDDDGSD